MARRTLLVGFSVILHGAFAVGIGNIEVSKSVAATAIEIAETPKKAKAPPPPPARVDPDPPKPEKRRASVNKPAALPPPEAPPPPSPAKAAAETMDALPDFGLSLSGGVEGTGVAVPAAPIAGAAPKANAGPVVRKSLSAAPAALPVDSCDEPPAKPRPRSVPQAAYTDQARAASIEGKVRVQLTVDETGRVVDVKLLQGLGYGLDEAALLAARQASFEPAIRCGKATRATFNISMRFTL